MLFKDYSCSSDITLQNKVDIGVFKLLGLDWASIISIGYSGSIKIDAVKDLGDTDNSIPLEFIEKYKYKFLEQTEPYSTYCYKNINFARFHIRTAETYKVFYIFMKKREPFIEDYLKWFNIYNEKAYSLLLSSNELIQNNELITNILDSTTSSIIVFDLELNLITFNEMAKSLIDNYEFNNNPTVNDLPFNNIETIESTIKEVINTGKKEILNELTISNENIDKIFTMTFSPLRNSNMKVVGVVAVGTDISEIQFLRYELEQLERYKQIGEISLGISHDIKNPLMNIKSCASHIQKYFLDNNDEGELLDIIIQEVDRINNVVDQLLSYGNVTKQDRYSFLNINQILLDCKQIIKRQKIYRNIEVGVDLADNLPPLNAKSRDIYQVFLNIILNAVQAIVENGYIHLSSNYLEKNKTIQVTVSDNGTGVKESDINKILIPYYTTKPFGRGLGLYLVKKTLARYNGELTINSELNKGTACIITLPCENN